MGAEEGGEGSSHGSEEGGSQGAEAKATGGRVRVDEPPAGARQASLGGSEVKSLGEWRPWRGGWRSRREERRVKEAYGVGMEVQVKKSEALMEELSQRSEERERKLTWELEEEKRKSQKQRRKEKGIVVKDRLAGRRSRIPTPIQPSIRAGPQWRNWDERWEAANKKKAANSQGDPRASTTTTGSVATTSRRKGANTSTWGRR
jgi:hypothetical protein